MRALRKRLRLRDVLVTMVCAYLIARAVVDGMGLQPLKGRPESVIAVSLIALGTTWLTLYVVARRSGEN